MKKTNRPLSKEEKIKLKKREVQKRIEAEEKAPDPKAPEKEEQKQERPKTINGNEYNNHKVKIIKQPGVGSGNTEGSKKTQFGGERGPQRGPNSLMQEAIMGSEEDMIYCRKKYNSPEKIKKVFEDLCKHIEHGHSPNSFDDLSIYCVRTYMKDFPKDFPRHELLRTCRKCLGFWEDMTIGQSTGMMKGNPTALRFFMVNVFGWKSERQDITSDDQPLQAPILIRYPSKEE